MCNNNTETNSGNCIAETLKVIQILQQNVCPESGLDSCDRPMLGGSPNCIVCNTRPIMLYTCAGNGTPFSMPTTKDATTDCTATGATNCSTVFRVEKVDNNCATFRVLIANETDGSITYTATDSFFTISLSCICVLKCLADTFIECL